MKKLSIFILLFLVLFSCNKKNSMYKQPESVIKYYFETMSKGNFTEAKKCVVPKSEGIINFVEVNLKPEKLAEVKKNVVVVENIETEVKNDTCVICSCTVKINDQTRKEKRYVDKIGDKWLVNLNH